MTSVLTENIERQWEELVARVLKVHARWRISNVYTYAEGIEHLRTIATIATDLADSLDDALRDQDERSN